MTPRLFCNVVYAWLAGRCQDEKSRKALDEDLYAPAGGWEAADQKLMAAIAAAPDPGEV